MPKHKREKKDSASKHKPKAKIKKPEDLKITRMASGLRVVVLAEAPPKKSRRRKRRRNKSKRPKKYSRGPEPGPPAK